MSPFRIVRISMQSLTKWKHAIKVIFLMQYYWVIFISSKSSNDLILKTTQYLYSTNLKLKLKLNRIYAIHITSKFSIIEINVSNMDCVSVLGRKLFHWERRGLENTHICNTINIWLKSSYLVNFCSNNCYIRMNWSSILWEITNSQ